MARAADHPLVRRSKEHASLPKRRKGKTAVDICVNQRTLGQLRGKTLHLNSRFVRITTIPRAIACETRGLRLAEQQGARLVELVCPCCGVEYRTFIAKFWTDGLPDYRWTHILQGLAAEHWR